MTYEIRANYLPHPSEHFVWAGVLIHVETGTIVDATRGPSEVGVLRLMQRRRDERTRPPARPVSNYGSGVTHLAHVADSDTVPVSPATPGEGRAYSPEAAGTNDRTTLCGIPLTARTLLSDRTPNCVHCTDAIRDLHEASQPQD